MKKNKHIKPITLLFSLLMVTGISMGQVSCPGYRTYTQGGWSSTPSGSNPGTYLNNNFAAAFPNGVIIGCTNTLKLTSPNAIRNYLPQSQTPSALPSGNLVNPSRSGYKNVLAGQLITLALNLGFDNHYASFAPATGQLKDLRIMSGPFMGWTVQQLFDQANRKIGGCSAANFSFSQYNTAVDLVNRNYDNGNVNGSFLACELKLSVNATNLLCFGGSDGAINLTITDGIPPYSVVWSNGATSEDISGLSAGTYTATVTDAGGQSRSISVTLTQPSEIIPSASLNDVSCNGLSDGSVTISATGGSGAYSGTGTYSGLAAGFYTFTITDANGCSASIEVEIKEPALLVALSDKSDIKCYGGSDGSVTITAEGGTAPYTGTGIFSGLAAGTYDYVVTDAHGCSASISVEVMQPDPIAIEGITTEVSDCSKGLCDGTAALTLVTGGVQPYEYFWSNGAYNVPDIGGLCEGDMVSVTVVDWNKCQAIYDFAIIACRTSNDDNNCDTLKTYTIGGWGAEPSGNNPGVYLHANFDAAFPSGLTIGCDNTLTLTSAQVITDWLPSGSTASLLPSGNMIDDITYDNVLASQLVAATLNMVFDQYDANFDDSPDALADRIMNIAPFNGMTVSQLISEANSAIGGCPTSFSLGELNSGLDAINNNYDNGNEDNGFLVCDDIKTEVRVTGPENSSLNFEGMMPNPANEEVNITFTAEESSEIQIDVLDLAGRTILHYTAITNAGTNNFRIETSAIKPQICLVRIQSGITVATRHLVIQR